MPFNLGAYEPASGLVGELRAAYEAEFGAADPSAAAVAEQVCIAQATAMYKSLTGTTVHADANANLGIGNGLYHDLLTSGLGIGKGGSAPTLKTFRGAIAQNAFAGSGPIEQGFFNYHVRHDIKAGTTPTLHVHWSHIIAAPTGDVRWWVELTAAKGYGGVFPATITVDVTQTAGPQYTHHISDDDGMPLPPSFASLLEPDMLILGRVFRNSADTADTFGDDAFLLQVDMHYQAGQLGTTERNRPFTSAGF